VSALGQAVRGVLEPLAARGYGAGAELSDAVALATHLDAAGVATTIGYWDGPGAPPARAPEAARDAIVAQRWPDGCVAVKGPPFVGVSESEISDLAGRAAAAGCRLLVDAPAPAQADHALELAVRLGAGGGDVGCALPGRWARSLEDADAAVAAGLAVRVVKGEWPDPGAGDRDPAAGFLAVVERLAGRARHVGVATHDPALASAALRTLIAAGTSCQLELLLGLPVRDVMARTRSLVDRPPRVYLPWGARGLPYEPAVRRDPRLALRLMGDVVAGPRRWRRTLRLAAG
jgi:proline dehydrogenase